MNPTELHIGVNLTVQKITSNINDDLLPQEIDYSLNEAVEDFIREQYSLLKIEDRSIESQYVTEGIRTLITTVDIDNTSTVGYIPNCIEGDLPSEYKYYISSRTKIDSTWRNNRILSPNAIKHYIETEYNSPLFREYPIVIEGDKFKVIYESGTTVSNPEVRMTYIKKPDKIDIIANPNTEYTSLPSHTHRTIVDVASRKILSVIGGISNDS